MFVSKLGSILVIPIIASSLSTPQIDFDYDGQVDIYTGAPIVEEATEEDFAQLVNLADGGIYDRVNHAFIYSLPGEEGTVKANVANGMITTSVVYLEVQDGFDIRLYKDGSLLSDVNLTEITDPGAYSIVTKNDDLQSQIMTFTILSKKTGAVDMYTLPNGFYTKSVSLDGELIQSKDLDVVDMSQEGDYRIMYRCSATDVDYELAVTVDHTPPQIILNGVTDGVARGPVTIEGLQNGESMLITKNDLETKLPFDDVLRSTGNYQVIAMDDAGNVTKESFVIKMYLNYQSVIFILLLVGIITAAAVYMYLSNKKLRVR